MSPVLEGRFLSLFPLLLVAAIVCLVFVLFLSGVSCSSPSINRFLRGVLMWNPRHKMVTHLLLYLSSNRCLPCPMTERACCPTPVAWHPCFTGGKDVGNQVWLCVCSQQRLASPSKFLCHWAGLSGLLPWEHSFSWAPCGGQWRGAGKWAQVPVMDRAPSWEAGMLAYTFGEFIMHLASFLFIHCVMVTLFSPHQPCMFFTEVSCLIALQLSQPLMGSRNLGCFRLCGLFFF